jgi:hypothetical protein
MHLHGTQCPQLGDNSLVSESVALLLTLGSHLLRWTRRGAPHDWESQLISFSSP